MTLSDIQAKAIIRDNPNGKAIKLKREKHEIMKAHVTGVGAADLITPIKEFERDTYAASRRKLGMSNKDIVHRVMMPVNKIYTAKGGVENYTLRTPDQANEFKMWLGQCYYRDSLKNFIRQVLQPAFFTDPEGLMWLEMDEYGRPCPTFKSIMQIYDYQLAGRYPEWVAFELTEREAKEIEERSEGIEVNLQGKLVVPPSSGKKQPSKVFRVVCDSYDRIITWEQSGEPVIVSQIPNPFAFMGVPAKVVSDIYGASTKDEHCVFDSPLAPSMELLTSLIFGRSLYAVTYARTAYPKEWMVLQPCPTCEGTGQVDSYSCPECKGKKVYPFQKHSDVLAIDYSNDVNKSVPVPPMGHVTVDVEALKYMKDNDMLLEDMVRYTQWGVLSVRSNGTKVSAGHGGNVSGTAYEAQQNEQPMLDQLALYSLWYSDAMKFYADGQGMFIYGRDYIDSGVMGGDRFMIESADATFDRLLKARQGGATKAELLSLTMEYIENKYQRNPIEYRKYKILAVAEPFYHDSVQEVMTYPIPDINKLEKIFFDEWQATLTDDYFALLPDQGLEQRVKEDLRNYTLTRISKDQLADENIYTAYGNLINIGDEVTVKRNKDMQDAAVGKRLTVKDTVGRYAVLTDGENDYTGYELDRLIKTKTNAQITN